MELPTPQGGNFETVPAGTYTARCYSFIDLGSHEQTFQNETKMKRLVQINFELPDEKMSDGRPFSVGKRYGWSTHEKSNLRKDLESWRGKKFSDSDFGPGGFNVKKLLGVPCTLSVAHNEASGYANISSIGPVMKGMVVPPAIHAPIYLSLDPKEFDREVFGGLHEKRQAYIAESPEYQAMFSGKTNGNGAASGRPVAQSFAADLDDEIPFAPEFR